jgi:hypothetical protein
MADGTTTTADTEREGGLTEDAIILLPTRNSEEPFFSTCDSSFFIQSLEVSAHDADRIHRPELLKLLAGRSPVAGQVVDGANGQTAIVVSPGGKMGAPLPGGLEDHGLFIIGFDAAVCQNAGGVDDKNIQMKAALAAA